MYVDTLLLHPVSIFYPNSLTSLDQAVNAPPYFGAIWSFVSKWIDPRTASKVVIVPPAQVLPTLALTIDLDQIPAHYGGNFSVRHGTLPKIDNGILQALTSSSFGSTDQLPAGPIKLGTNQEGEMTLIAVGTEEGGKRQNTIGLIR